MPTKHDTNCSPSGCHFDDRPHVYSILHSEPWFKRFLSCFVGLMFVQHLVAWKQGQEEHCCWQPKHKKCCLSLLLKRKGRFCRAIAGGRDESCLRKLYSRQHRHWAVCVSCFLTGVAEDQIVDQIYSKIQLPKACYCCMIYGIRTMPNKAEAICYNNIHECH